MKKFTTLLIAILLPLLICAQRGKVRPEWDFNNGDNVVQHSINDDLYSFLFIIGIVFVLFIGAYLYGIFVGRPKEEAKRKLEEQRNEEINKKFVYVFKHNASCTNEDSYRDEIIHKGERCLLVEICSEDTVVVDVIGRPEGKRRFLIDREDIEKEGQ